jgi:hypothetical protein
LIKRHLNITIARNGWLKHQIVDTLSVNPRIAEHELPDGQISR